MRNMKTMRHIRKQKGMKVIGPGANAKVKVRGVAYSGFVVSIAAMR